MMMMASSSSSSASGRDGQQATKVTRHNSSFLGAIKHIVTAPFSWFGNADDGADVAGSKRRRPEFPPAPTAVFGIQGVPTEIIIEEQTSNCEEDDRDEAPRGSKRMRLNSPSKTTKAATDLKPAIRRSSVVPRASSAVLPSSRRTSRATHSPKRNTQLYPPIIQRTMSIDPPQLAFRRDTPSASFNFGVDVDMVGLDTHDLSMPPSPSRLSPRPSFRMRSSMTPQPIQHTLPQRHISEPPPLNALFSNPIFVHPPQEKETTPIPAPVPTLGTLVESARNVRLPVKHQHVSLLFNKSNEDETQNDVPAERALQQLDIYKTPLLPSRMRSDADSITANVIPDMFKSRRASRPVLMSDDRESGTRKKGPVMNETKPYAGQGGMKKLLARAKLEAEKERANEKDDMDKTRVEVSEPPSVPLPPPPPPPLVTSDWFKSAVSGTSAPPSGTSLRVGRQKTSRHHFQRPSKSRFSAAYEDEGDDAIEDGERAKERRMLEEAATKVPVFKIPSEFTFAKDTPAPLPSSDDLQKAKEPPINSLPFSLSKSSTPSALAKIDSVPMGNRPPVTLTFGTTSENSSSPLPFSFEKPTSTSTSSTAVLPTNGTAVPNFFGNSQVLNGESKNLPPFVDSTSAASGTGSTGPRILPSSTSGSLEKPDAEPNPFLEEPTKSVPSIFGASNATLSASSRIGKPETTVHSSVLSPAQFTFGVPSTDQGSSNLPPVESKPITGPSSFGKTVEEQKPASLFSFGKPPEGKPTATAPTSSSGTSSFPFTFEKPAEKPSATSLPFSFTPTAGTTEKKPEAAPIAPEPLFEPSTGSTSTTSTALQGTTLFGEPPKTTTPFTGVPPPQSTPSPLPFAFGHLPGSGSAATSTAGLSTETAGFSFGSANTSSGSTTTAQPPVVEPPKPLFGPFSFSQEKKQQEVTSLSFPFGAVPSTPPTAAEVNPAASFSFGSSSSAPAAATPSISFSFSGGTGTDVTTKPAFIFGVPSSAAQLERPVTPPKLQDQEVRMEESPVREMQVNGKALETPPMINAQFSFGVTSNGVNGSTLFGGTSSGPIAASPTSPFTFGAPLTTFAAKKSEESKPFGGFGAAQAPPINTSFSFGKDESRPTSAFTFAQTPTSATNATPSFSFGVPTNATPNPFVAAAGSAPGSPSTFTQPAPFAFGGPSGTTGSFAFGSQPSSPASGSNITLPQPTMSTTTTFGSGPGFGQTPSPASPFTAPLPLAQSTSSGGTLFTIGAPPVGQRQIKKLPRRGNNVKR